MRRRLHKPVAAMAEMMTMKPWRMLKVTETQNIIEEAAVVLDQVLPEEILERRVQVLGKAEQMVDERRCIFIAWQALLKHFKTKA